MQVLALVTQKGGTGKSSLAVSLAVAAQESGLSSAIIDLDQQGTATEWSKRRKASTPTVTPISAMSLVSKLHRLALDGIDLALIDTPGADSSASEIAMREASFCLIPVRPSIADIEAAKPTIRYLNSREKQFAFVLNQCPVGGRTSRTSNAFRALQLIGGVCEPTLALRSDHMDAMASGLGVTEHARSGKAAGEMTALLDWVWRGMQRARSAPNEGRHAAE
jgi:chromosome partitioning protein